MREIEGEVVIYDRDRHQAHCLNRSAGLVFRHCDGETNVKQLAQLLQAEIGAPANEGWALLAIERLSKAGLVEVLPRDIRFPANSRRELLRRAGLVSVALLPLVMTLAVPAASQTAATCVSSCAGQPNGQPCGPPLCIFTCDGTGNCV